MPLIKSFERGLKGITLGLSSLDLAPRFKLNPVSGAYVPYLWKTMAANGDNGVTIAITGANDVAGPPDPALLHDGSVASSTPVYYSAGANASPVVVAVTFPQRLVASSVMISSQGPSFAALYSSNSCDAWGLDGRDRLGNTQALLAYGQTGWAAGSTSGYVPVPKHDPCDKFTFTMHCPQFASGYATVLSEIDILFV